MTKTAFLHIGTEKTGTTTIQHFLHANRLLLAKQGFDIPNLHKDKSQFWLPLLAYDDSNVDNMVLSYNLTAPTEVKLFKEQTHLALSKLVAGSSCKSFIFSSEYLSSRLKTKAHLTRLKEVLEPLFGDIVVIVYLRQPLAAALSLFSTAIQAGNTNLLFSPAASANVSICNHKKMLSLWESIFPGRVQPRLFQKSSFVDQDLLSDFCSSVGIQLDDSYSIPDNFNESLSWLAMKVMATINIHFPRFLEDGSRNKKRGDILRFIKDIGVGMPRYMPSESEATDYTNFFASSTEWVRSRYFPDRESLWDSTPTTRSAEDQYFCTELTIPEQELVNAIVSIWQDKSAAAPVSSAIKLRDIALKIERQEALDLNDATEILEVARAINPAGQVIQKRLADLKARLNTMTPRTIELTGCPDLPAA